MFSWTSWHLHQWNMGLCLNSHPETRPGSSSLVPMTLLRAHGLQSQGCTSPEGHWQRIFGRGIKSCLPTLLRGKEAQTDTQTQQEHHSDLFFSLSKVVLEHIVLLQLSNDPKRNSKTKHHSHLWLLSQVCQQRRNINLHAKRYMLQLWASRWLLILSIIAWLLLCLLATETI